MGILLAWRHLVAVYLINRKTGLKLLLGKKADTSKLSQPFDFTHLQSAESRPEFCSILLNQLLQKSNQRSCSWSTVSASNTYTKVRGMLSSIPAANRKIQYISDGIRPLLPGSTGCELYEEVNQLFANSTFGDKVIDVVVDESELERRSQDRRFKQDGFTRKHLTTVSKGVSRWPMFSLWIEPCSNQKGFHSPFHHVHLAATRMMLKTVITQWLVEHQFQKQAVYKEQQSPTSTTRFPTAQHGGPNVKPLSKVRIGDGATARGIVCSATRPKSSDASLSSLRAERSAGAQLAKDDSLSDCEVWQDPMTKEIVHINKRTGMPHVPRFETCPIESTKNNGIYASLRPRSASILLSKRPPSSSAGVTGPRAWVDRLTADWDESVFSRPEPSIKTVGLLEKLPVCSGRTTGNLHRHGRRKTLSEQHLQLSRTSLQRAEVVTQVDTKFILVKVPSIIDSAALDTATDLLVLIDQHAADERCIVESLYSDICTLPSVLEARPGTKPVLLTKPIVAPVTNGEGEVLERVSERFLKYKIDYEIISKSQVPNSRSSGLHVRVKSLPPEIAERCTADPKLIIDILRTEANLEQKHGPCREEHDDAADEVHSWTRNIGDCPQGIIEMLNSRACRSAIMFNDELSTDACSSLITRLSRCALPFQCAHGRPSMVPLMDLSKMSLSPPSDGLENLGTALKRWKPRLSFEYEAYINME